MRMRATGFALMALGLLVTGCGSSLVGGECEPGLTACGGRCIDLERDVLHCGACGQACGAGEACVAGTCSGASGDASLDAGSRDAAADASADAPVDALVGDGARADGAPGDAAVGDGGRGDGGSAGDGGDAGFGGCDIGQFECQGVCIDLTSDIMFCGDCATTCSAGEVCAAGECELDCDPPLTACGDRCLDTSEDADNCGGCGRRCESGICREGECVDPEAGHIVVIGHDYRSARPGMNRIAGNSIFLGRGAPVRVLAYEGEAQMSSIRGVDRAIDQVATATGRSWTRTVAAGPDVPLLLADADAFVIYAQQGADDATLQALGTEWGTALRSFLRLGGVIILFETDAANMGTYQILDSAGLFSASGRTDVSGADLQVVAAGDAVALGVPLMYRGETTTVRFDTTEETVVVAHPDGPVVIHRVVAP